MEIEKLYGFTKIRPVVYNEQSIWAGFPQDWETFKFETEHEWGENLDYNGVTAMVLGESVYMYLDGTWNEI